MLSWTMFLLPRTVAQIYKFRSNSSCNVNLLYNKPNKKIWDSEAAQEDGAMPVDGEQSEGG